MKTMKVFIEKGKDEYSAYLDDNSLDYSCIGTGLTVDEAIADFRSAYEEMKAFFKSKGKPFEEIETVFYYDIPSFLREYAFAFSLAAEIERNLISQRTREALAAKKKAGVKLGRPKGISRERQRFTKEYASVMQKIESGETLSSIARWLKIHPNTLSRYLKEGFEPNPEPNGLNSEPNHKNIEPNEPNL